MPFRCSDYQSRFSWQLADDLPVCDVILLGGVPYVACCALCGCLHELRGAIATGAIIAPRCLLREYASQGRSLGQTAAWHTLYSDWLARFPEAPAYTAIRVKLTTINELMARPAVKLAAKKRKAAAPKRAVGNRKVKVAA